MADYSRDTAAGPITAETGQIQGVTRMASANLVKSDSCVHPTIEPCSECVVTNRVMHSFQTGALYTAEGQRIGWTVLPSGRIAMYDVDRMIDYVLDCEPNDRAVHEAYLHNRTVGWSEETKDDIRLARSLERELCAAARTAPSVDEVRKAKGWRV